jgi:hypothetical protein
MVRIALRVFAFVVIVAAMCAAADAPRVFIKDTQSWDMRADSGGAGGIFGGKARGGARPQTAEVIKTFGQRCPEVVVNNKEEKADYVVTLDYEGGKSIVAKDTKIAVFNRDGDSIMSHSTRSVGNAVKDACDAIKKDWSGGSSSDKAAEKTPDHQTQAVDARVSATAENSDAHVQVTSQPAGADIEIDGAFMGSTPSAVELTPGDHTVRVTKKGYQSWQRKIRVTAGDITLAAELTKGQ